MAAFSPALPSAGLALVVSVSWIGAIVVLRVQAQTKTDLPHTINGLGNLAGQNRTGKRRRGDAREDRDDTDDNEQFDERERPRLDLGFFHDDFFYLVGGAGAECVTHAKTKAHACYGIVTAGFRFGYFCAVRVP